MENVATLLQPGTIYSKNYWFKFDLYYYSEWSIKLTRVMNYIIHTKIIEVMPIDQVTAINFYLQKLSSSINHTIQGYGHKLV